MKNGYLWWALGLIAIAAHYYAPISETWRESFSIWHVFVGLCVIYSVNTLGDKFQQLNATISNLSADLVAVQRDVIDLELACERLKDRCDLFQEALENADVEIPLPPIPSLPTRSAALPETQRRPIIIARR